jgi:diguanylate cyclase (GGDEF)-like protein/PAS domain S-box-containing protein
MTTNNFKNLAIFLAITLMSSIFLGELIIMCLLSYVITLPPYIEAFIDPLLLIILCTPIIYFVVLLPLKNQITTKNKMETQLLVSAAAFQTHDGILITDADLKIIRINRAFAKMSGFSEPEVLGKNPNIFNSEYHEEIYYERIWKEVDSNGFWKGEIWVKCKNDKVLPMHTTISAVINDDGITQQYVAVYTNISEIKKAEDEIYSLAFHDVLTGLPNRRLLNDRLDVALSSSGRSELYGAILLLDLDNFKTINDNINHECGDNLLIEVSNRLKFSIRESDTVSRIGGDAFVVMLENLGTNEADAAQKAAHIAENLRSILSKPFSIDKNILNVSPSIGICLFLDHNISVPEVIKRAEMAMYQAKNSGRNRTHFFDPQMQQSIETQNELVSDLHLALQSNQLKLYYQMQLDTNRSTIGAEALIRWDHPQRGLISPVEFIPVAEKSSLIIDIGNWVLNTVCQQIALWSKSELTKNLVIAINISPRQFMQPDFVELLAANIYKYQIDASRIKLELTESVMIDDLDQIVKKMYILKHIIGVTLSLDDFGTGYSSLSYLKQLPIDQIKIDQSFVRHMTTDISDAMMVKNIIDMAHNFGFDVIAEGVETEAQLALLKKNGCLSYQGYLFSKPIPVTQFEILLNQNLISINT